MKLAAALTLALLASGVAAQTTCTTIGTFTTCSDGSSAQRIGNMTFGNDGSSAQRIGNQTFIQPGYTAPTPPPTYFQPQQPIYQPQQPYRPPVCGLTSMGQYVCQ
jgi:hypothetical protein